jgi:hypothetical protein
MVYGKTGHVMGIRTGIFEGSRQASPLSRHDTRQNQKRCAGYRLGHHQDTLAYGGLWQSTLKPKLAAFSINVEAMLRTAERVRVRQGPILISLPEVMEGANEARYQIFADFWRKLRQQSTFRLYVGV